MTPRIQDILMVIEEFLTEISFSSSAYNSFNEASENPVVQFFSDITQSNPTAWLQQCDDGAWSFNLEKIYSFRNEVAKKEEAEMYN